MEKFIDVFGLKKSKKLSDDELYVMLMLQRSEEGTAAKVDCDDAAIALACELDSDKCPAECKEGAKEDSEKEDTVVKSGDLAVTAKAAEGRKAIIGGTSDLDTITFKTSEDVTISNITLERYGYSTIDDVVSVQLEDEDGNIIADAKELNSKGQVKLTLKKDYKTVDGTFKATIVVNTRSLPVEAIVECENPQDETTCEVTNADDVEAYAGKKNGSTLGFKVVAADSTAKNLNLDDYSPYTYDLVNYDGSKVEFSSRNSENKEYNYEAGELYEVAKFRVKAPSDAAILVKGFTLSDERTAEQSVVAGISLGKIDAAKYVKDVEATVDGKEVKGFKWNINKDDELVVSFDEVEIAAKQTSTFVVKASFNEDFDQFGYSIKYSIANMNKFNALDKKTESRVSASKQPEEITWTTYTIRGGKIKLTGTKLGTINAAAGSTNVKVAEGNITITEAIRGTANIKVKAASVPAIDEIRLVVNGEEFDGSKGTTAAGVTTYNFKGVEIDKSGKVEVRVDLKSADEIGDITSIDFDESINSASFVGFKYDESGKEFGDNEISGSINLSSIRIQAAKASLNNKNTTKVELVIGETNRKTIFDGTYEAKKGAIILKNFEITDINEPLTINGTTTKYPTFYVTVDGEDYDAKWSNNTTCAISNKTACAKGDIDDIEVAAGKSVNVKVEIEYSPDASAIEQSDTFNIAFEGEDEDNNKAGLADEDTVRVEVVEQGTINITNSSEKKTVLLKSNREVAQFTIKPSKSSDDDTILKSIEFVWTGDVNVDNVKFTIDDDDYTTAETSNPRINCVAAGGGNGRACTLNNIGTSIPSSGVVVKVTLKSEVGETGAKVDLTISEVNGKKVNSEFSKYYVPALVKITQDNAKGKDTTTYTAELTNDTSYDVSALKLFIDKPTAGCPDGSTVAVAGDLNNFPTVNEVEKTAADYCLVASKNSLSEGSAEDNKFSATNDDKAHSITAISYVIGTDTPAIISIYKSDFENFFEKAYSSDDLMVYSNKS